MTVQCKYVVVLCITGFICGDEMATLFSNAKIRMIC